MLAIPTLKALFSWRGIAEAASAVPPTSKYLSPFLGVQRLDNCASRFRASKYGQNPPTFTLNQLRFAHLATIHH